jgi:hypothetical protein
MVCHSSNPAAWRPSLWANRKLSRITVAVFFGCRIWIQMAVLNSLGSPASRRVYEYAIDQFIAWYCSEPRLALNRIVVVRYRMYLESRGLAANTINQQLAAVRRLAHEPPIRACSVPSWLRGSAE